MGDITIERTSAVVQIAEEAIVLENMGWYPRIAFARRSTDEAVVLEVTGWGGGTGEEPPTGWITGDGTLTGDVALAAVFPTSDLVVQVRGEGEATGRAIATMAITDGTSVGATTADWQNVLAGYRADNGLPGDTDAELRIPRTLPDAQWGFVATANQPSTLGEERVYTPVFIPSGDYGTHTLQLPEGGQALDIVYERDTSGYFGDGDRIKVRVKSGSGQEAIDADLTLTLSEAVIGAAAGGLDQAAVDSSIAAAVEDFAEVGKTGTIPLARFGDGVITEEKLAQAVRDAIAAGEGAGDDLTTAQVNALIAAAVEDFAEVSKGSSTIPAARIGADTIDATKLTAAVRAMLGSGGDAEETDYDTPVDLLTYTRDLPSHALSQGSTAGVVRAVSAWTYQRGDSELTIVVNGVSGTYQLADWLALPAIADGTDVLLSGATDHLSVVIGSNDYLLARTASNDYLLGSDTVADVQTVAATVSGYRLADFADRRKTAQAGWANIATDSAGEIEFSEGRGGSLKADIRGGSPFTPAQQTKLAGLSNPAPAFRDGVLTNAARAHVQEILNAFDGDGWADSTGPTDALASHPAVSSIVRTAPWTTQQATAATYVRTATLGVRHETAYAVVRVPVVYEPPVSRIRLRVGTGAYDPEDESEQWHPLSDATVLLTNATYVYYMVEVGGYGAGDSANAQVFTPFELDTDVVSVPTSGADVDNLPPIAVYDTDASATLTFASRSASPSVDDMAIGSGWNHVIDAGQARISLEVDFSARAGVHGMFTVNVQPKNAAGTNIGSAIGVSVYILDTAGATGTVNGSATVNLPPLTRSLDIVGFLGGSATWLAGNAVTLTVDALTLYRVAGPVDAVLPSTLPPIGTYPAGGSVTIPYASRASTVQFPSSIPVRVNPAWARLLANMQVRAEAVVTISGRTGVTGGPFVMNFACFDATGGNIGTYAVTFDTVTAGATGVITGLASTSVPASTVRIQPISANASSATWSATGTFTATLSAINLYAESVVDVDVSSTGAQLEIAQNSGHESVVQLPIQTWAQTGNTEEIPAAKIPRTGLAVEQLIDGAGIGITIVDSASDVVGAFRPFSPQFQLSQAGNMNGIIEVEATLTLTGRTSTTIGWTTDTVSPVLDQSFDEFTFASNVRAANAYSATSREGVRLARFTVRNGSGELGFVSIYLARDATTNALGYHFFYDGNGGALGFAITVQMEAAFIRNDAPVVVQSPFTANDRLTSNMDFNLPLPTVGAWSPWQTVADITLAAGQSGRAIISGYLSLLVNTERSTTTNARMMTDIRIVQRRASVDTELAYIRQYGPRNIPSTHSGSSREWVTANRSMRAMISAVRGVQAGDLYTLQVRMVSQAVSDSAEESADGHGPTIRLPGGQNELQIWSV